MVAAALAQRPLRPGPRVGTDGLGQNGRQESIREQRAYSSSVCLKSKNVLVYVPGKLPRTGWSPCQGSSQPLSCYDPSWLSPAKKL